MRKIKLMAEYGCYPLWDITDPISKNIPIDSLPISDNLKLEIVKWADIFEKTLNEEYPPESGFKSLDELNSFEYKAQEIIMNLRKELGNEVNINYEKTASIM